MGPEKSSRADGLYSSIAGICLTVSQNSTGFGVSVAITCDSPRQIHFTVDKLSLNSKYAQYVAIITSFHCFFFYDFK